MGAQQLLLIILGFMIVGLGLYVGMQLFDVYNQDGNRDQLILQMQQINAYVEAYATKPPALGGSSGSFNRCSIPKNMLKIPAGTITATSGSNYIIMVGTGVTQGKDKATPVRVQSLYFQQRTWTWILN